MTRNLIVGISGASGAILGVRMLIALRRLEVRSHLVVSAAGRTTLRHETGMSIEAVEALADITYPNDAIGAAIASGSFAVDGMIVIPSSIKTLSAVANSYSADLLARAADVNLKEGRPLVLVVRETPLHAGHLDLMKRAATLGAIIYPPVPAFYAHPQSLEEIADQIVGRVLARIGIPNDLAPRWAG